MLQPNLMVVIVVSGTSVETHIRNKTDAAICFRALQLLGSFYWFGTKCPHLFEHSKEIQKSKKRGEMSGLTGSAHWAFGIQFIERTPTMSATLSGVFALLIVCMYVCMCCA